MKSLFSLRFSVVMLFVFFSAFSRLIPHPPNFTSILVVSIFSAAYFEKKIWAILIPVISVWLSDLVIDNVIYASYYNMFQIVPEGWWWLYGSQVIISLVSIHIMKVVTFKSILFANIFSLLFFYLITNFFCWPGNPMYTQDLNGLIQCYIAGLPFLGSNCLGNIFFSLLLFGTFHVVDKKILTY